MGKNITFSPMFNTSHENTLLTARKVHLFEKGLLGDFSSDELLLLDYAVIEL
jgi:hypothetical protein